MILDFIIRNTKTNGIFWNRFGHYYFFNFPFGFGLLKSFRGIVIQRMWQNITKSNVSDCDTWNNLNKKRGKFVVISIDQLENTFITSHRTTNEFHRKKNRFSFVWQTQAKMIEKEREFNATTQRCIQTIKKYPYSGIGPPKYRRKKHLYTKMSVYMCAESNAHTSERKNIEKKIFDNKNRIIFLSLSRSGRTMKSIIIVIIIVISILSRSPCQTNTLTDFFPFNLKIHIFRLRLIRQCCNVPVPIE